MRQRRELWTGAAAAMLLACASGAAAQVIDISPDGAVTRYDGPTQFLNDGAHPMTPEREPPAQSRSATPTDDVARAIHDASERHQVSEQLVSAVAWRESGFNPSAVSPKGAVGVMQLMPGTARLLGVNAADPRDNIDGGADYLGRMLRRFDGDTTKALAAYNAGPEAVERYQGVPPYAETIAYVGAILKRLNARGVSPVIGGPAAANTDFR